MSQNHISKVIATDASNQGWGGNFGHQIAQGSWSNTEKQLHINCLEVEAVVLTVQKFLPQLVNQSMLIRSNSSTVIQYINRQGGLGLLSCVTQLGNFGNKQSKQHKSERGPYSGITQHSARPVEQNSSKVDGMDIERCKKHKIFHIWVEQIMDLVASYHNKKIDIFCTWDHHPHVLAVDAFSMSWNQMFAYAFPPICLILKVFQHMRLGQCQVILIAPQWPRRHWYPDLLEMCIANPIKLPLRQELLRQPKSIIYHLDPEVFSLNAWLLSTYSSKQEVFHKELEVYCQHRGGQVLRKTTLVNSSSSVAGVVRNKLIYIQHL